MDLNVSLAPGWARANCSGPVKASLLYRLHNSEGAPTAEAGVNATAVPATRFVTFAEQGEDQFGTGVAYANPSPTYRSLSPLLPGTRLGRCWPASFGHCHPEAMMRTVWRMSLFGLTSFTGSIEVTSTEPIVSLSLNFEADPRILLLASGRTGCFRAMICQVKPDSKIEQDFNSRFRQPQPSGNPIQSLDILRLSRPAQQICKRLSRFRRVSCDVGCHPKDFLHIECASNPDPLPQPFTAGSDTALRQRLKAIGELR